VESTAREHGLDENGISGSFEGSGLMGFRPVSWCQQLCSGGFGAAWALSRAQGSCNFFFFFPLQFFFFCFSIFLCNREHGLGRLATAAAFFGGGGDGVARHGWASTDFSLSFHLYFFSSVFHFCLFSSSISSFGSLFFPCYLNLVMEWQIGFW
jgi:hypothetical protein